MQVARINALLCAADKAHGLQPQFVFIVDLIKQVGEGDPRNSKLRA